MGIDFFSEISEKNIGHFYKPLHEEISTIMTEMDVEQKLWLKSRFFNNF